MGQAHGVRLGLAQTLVVACTSTLAAVGAAAIPSAGLVTMLMVLQVGPLKPPQLPLPVYLLLASRTAKLTGRTQHVEWLTYSADVFSQWLPRDIVVMLLVWPLWLL